MRARGAEAARALRATDLPQRPTRLPAERVAPAVEMHARLADVVLVQPVVHHLQQLDQRPVGAAYDREQHLEGAAVAVELGGVVAHAPHQVIAQRRGRYLDTEWLGHSIASLRLPGGVSAVRALQRVKRRCARSGYAESPRSIWYERDAVPDTAPQNPDSASDQIDARIAELGDWRGELLARLRAVVKKADPEVVEEWKWAKATSPGVPVWSHDGIICTGETYKSVVKMTFAKGASLDDPTGLFNSSLEGNTRRAIDFREGEEIDEPALAALIRAAVALNTSRRG